MINYINLEGFLHCVLRSDPMHRNQNVNSLLE